MVLLDDDAVVEFAEEDPNPEAVTAKGAPWNILVVDDDQGVHDITRLTLKDFTFKGSPLRLIHAYDGDQVKAALREESDIALILLDVVMEEEDTGLALVDYIRNQLGNGIVRIVLRTGQPGIAPEQDVITRYDINEYKTKTELTAQKLFTSVTVCLRAYESLRTIERSREGMARITRATARVFQHQSFSGFGESVLEQLHRIIQVGVDQGGDAAYFVGMPRDHIRLMAGTGIFKGRRDDRLDQSFSPEFTQQARELCRSGGEYFQGRYYMGANTSKEGVVSLFYLKAPFDLTEVDRNLLRIYAHNIAVGFENLSLAHEIINTQKEVILTLGEVVETRSQETANHVNRVAEFCYLLAVKSGMDPGQAELLRLAAPMHDVGKIGVPESILHKPGKLTSHEFEIMKQHAPIGYEILKKSSRPIMQAAAIVAHQHHERWDGTGYPNGLAGHGIHIFGRIGAVADVFDALSHARCYKEAWSRERIENFFREASGTQFDPGLTKLFLENMDAFLEINKRFPE
ncbi:MAG: DUF3369 domain-containing protein [Desulfobacterales bacterium]|nr:DUF3369 domain-containing protein [Desulfobacterales bacterium]